MSAIVVVAVVRIYNISHVHNNSFLVGRGRFYRHILPLSLSHSLWLCVSVGFVFTIGLF